MITPDTPLKLVTFVAVDVETTGLDPLRDKIVELAAVKVQNGAVVDQFQTLVSINRTIPAAARKVHHIDNSMLVGKPPIREVLPQFFEFSQDGALVEHSYKSFDVNFLEHAHGRSIDAPYISTCTLSRKLFPHIPRHSLAECCKRFRIVNQESHRALADAQATAKLLLCLLELCSTRYPRLNDLVKIASVQR